VKLSGSTWKLLSKLDFWSLSGAKGIGSVAVKCVDIARNTGGEGALLGYN
jgi:hypothetical protein